MVRHQLYMVTAKEALLTHLKKTSFETLYNTVLFYWVIEIHCKWYIIYQVKNIDSSWYIDHPDLTYGQLFDSGRFHLLFGVTSLALGQSYPRLQGSWGLNGVHLGQIARFMRPTQGPLRAQRTLVGPMLAPWTLLSRTIVPAPVKNHYPEDYGWTNRR